MQRFPVAVTGLGVLCAAGSDAPSLWTAVLGGATAIRPVSRRGFEQFAHPLAGEIDEAWLEKDFSDHELEVYSRDSRAGIVAARQALQMAGLQPASARVGLVVGKCQGASRGASLLHSWIHSTADGMAACLGLAGPRLTISTACAAGGNAIGAARDRLWSGEAEVMLAGGVDLLDPRTYAGFNALRSLDDRPCAPYTRSGGLTLGEGAAFLVIEPLHLAQQRGAPILCQLLGYGLSADAHHATAPDPTGRGAVLAGHRALAEAGLKAEDVTYVNGHGTGTSSNDSTERRVMRSLFGDKAGAVPITGTKSFTGHTLGAAGAVEAVVTVLSIAHQAIPPTVNVDHSAPLDLDVVPDVARPAVVEVVLSNNYAFGGNNVSVLFGSPRARPAQCPPLDEVDVVVSGVGLWGRPGLGLPEWAQALQAAALPATEQDPTSLLRKRPFAAPSAWRHMNGFTRALLAVTRLALDDAQVVLDRERRDATGVFSGTMSGAAEAQRSLFDEATRVPSAHEFAQTVLNAPAGTVCQVLGLRGPTTTIVSGGVSGTLALQAAVEFIQLGRADTVIVLAAEEMSAPARQLYDEVNSLGLAPGADAPDVRALSRASDVSSAAVGLVLQSSQTVTAGQSPYCTVSGVRHSYSNLDAYRHDPSGSGLSAALAAVEEAAGWSGTQADLLVGLEGLEDSLSQAHAAATRAVGGTRIHPKTHTGECEAASGLANVALAAAAVAGRLPASVTPQPRRALATSAAAGGVYGCVALQAWQGLPG